MKRIVVSVLVNGAAAQLAAAGRLLGREHPGGVLCAELSVGVKRLARA